jgi:hypothetical protein
MATTTPDTRNEIMNKTSFIGLDTAIGRLYLAGVDFRVNRVDNNTYLHTPTDCIYCFRDGTTNKVKEDDVEDSILDAYEDNLLTS